MVRKVKSSREVAVGFLLCIVCFCSAAWAMSIGAPNYGLFFVAAGLVSVVMASLEAVDRMDGG